jgi:hypothetical protein
MVEKIDRLVSSRFTHARRSKKVLHGKTARIEQAKECPNQEMMHLRLMDSGLCMV